MSRISKKQLTEALYEYCALRPDRATFEGETFVIHAEPVDLARKALLAFGLVFIGGGGLFGLYLSGRAVVDPELSSPRFFICAGIGMFVAAVWLILIIVSGTSQRRIIDLRTGAVSTRSMIRSKKWTDLTRVSRFEERAMHIPTVPIAGQFVLPNAKISTHLYLDEVRPGKAPKKVYFLGFSTSDSLNEFVPIMTDLIAHFYKPVSDMAPPANAQG